MALDANGNVIPEPVIPQDVILTPGPVDTTSALTLDAWKAANPKPSGGWTLADGKTTSDASKAYSNYTSTFQGTPTNPAQMNIVDYSAQLAVNPSLGLVQDNPATPTNESMSLSDRVPDINENTTGTNISSTDPKYGIDPAGTNATTQTATAQTAAQVDPRTTATYEAQQTQAAVAGTAMTAAQGTVNPNAVITAPQIDMQGTATGVNADGSVNHTGTALNAAATQNISNIIDTSTPSGKALAALLGEGNYTDSQATMKGQLEILQSEFVGPNGEPKIPAWAAATARSVGKIAAFSGVTGTAGIAAMSQALMEASLPVAQQDAQFFQTLTVQNLSNRQAATLNKANVLAKMDQVNVDNRMAAAIQNSKNFMDMDLTNLNNEQQSRVINTQARVQSILEDARSVNAQRLFTAESTNEMGKFYDQLSTNIEQFNTSQKNAMSQFNTGEINSTEKFNSELENNRERFYKEMQFQIDTANAKWRQTVTLTENQQAFEAAATDVKNLVGISVEQMNQIWDRSDALLDYIWKSGEGEKDRAAALMLEKLRASSAEKSAESAGWGSIFGSVAGAATSSFLNW